MLSKNSKNSYFSNKSNYRGIVACVSEIPTHFIQHATLHTVLDLLTFSFFYLFCLYWMKKAHIQCDAFSNTVRIKQNVLEKRIKNQCFGPIRQACYSKSLTPFFVLQFRKSSSSRPRNNIDSGKLPTQRTTMSQYLPRTSVPKRDAKQTVRIKNLENP